jgi:DNA-binding CsgD family transcriptional regulator
VLDILPELHKFLNFLNHRPSVDELSRRFLQDFVFMVRPIAMSVLTLSPINKIAVKYATGEEQLSNNSASSDKYQNLCESFNSKNLVSDLIEKHALLDNQGKSILSPVSNGKVVNGLVKLDCEDQITNENFLLIRSYMPTISFYLYPTLQNQGTTGSISSLQINPLTSRQRQVLTGFIEGKTNHELAVDLGFSISTIRHETMAIFKLLGASDRKEAAKIAQESSLI